MERQLGLENMAYHRDNRNACDSLDRAGHLRHYYETTHMGVRNGLRLGLFRSDDSCIFRKVSVLD